MIVNSVIQSANLLGRARSSDTCQESESSDPHFPTSECSRWPGSSALMPRARCGHREWAARQLERYNKKTRSAQDRWRRLSVASTAPPPLPPTAFAALCDVVVRGVDARARWSSAANRNATLSWFLFLPGSCWYWAPAGDNPRGVLSISTRIGSGRWSAGTRLSTTGPDKPR